MLSLKLAIMCKEHVHLTPHLWRASCMHSLVPRPSTPPVFARLRYAKILVGNQTGGVEEGLGTRL